jgi:hypothetical protein
MAIQTGFFTTIISSRATGFTVDFPAILRGKLADCFTGRALFNAG